MPKTLRLATEYKRGDRIGNRYKVHSLEKGGMGVVYFCIDLELDHPVALKSPLVGADADTERRESVHRRFLREARTWAALGKHPNIVHCYYLDRVDEQPFLFLEWIADPNRKRTSLYHLIRRGGIDLDLGLAISLDIAYGMQFAGVAQPGIVHRDLKPGNVLVAQDMTAKISDFGLASIWLPEHGEERRDNRIVGTPMYRPPEIWMRGPTDARSDIYACGLMLYEMLTGERAIQINEIHDIEKAHLIGETPHLPESMPEEVDAIIQRATQRSYEERYESFDELIVALQAAITAHTDQHPKPPPVGGVMTAGDHVNLGNTFAWLDRHKDSLEEYNLALALDGKSAAALQNRGALYMMMGQPQPALDDLNAAINISPRTHSAYYNRAVVLNAVGNAARALQDYNRVLSLSPSNVSAYYNRAILLRDSGQLEQALVDFTRVVRLTPGAYDAFHNRGLTHLELNDYQSALSDFTRAIEINPDQVVSWYNRGVVHQLLGEYDEALRDFTSALDRNESFRPALELRAILRHERGDHQGALDDYTRAILVGPDERVDLYYNRGLLLIELGQYEAAILNLDHALAVDRHYLPAQVARAQAFLLNDQPEKAREIGQALLLLGFDSVTLHQHLYELFKAIGDEELAAVALQHGEGLQLQRAESDIAAAFANMDGNMDGNEGDSGSAEDRVAAFEALLAADAPEAVEALVQRYPFISESSFVSVTERLIEQREQKDVTMSARQKTANRARLLWLRHYARL